MRTGVPSFWLGPSERSQTKGGCAPVCIQNSLLIRLPIVTWTGAGHKHPAHHGQVWHNKVPKQVQAQEADSVIYYSVIFFKIKSQRMSNT